MPTSYFSRDWSSLIKLSSHSGTNKELTAQVIKCTVCV